VLGANDETSLLLSSTCMISEAQLAWLVLQIAAGGFDSLPGQEVDNVVETIWSECVWDGCWWYQQASQMLSCRPTSEVNVVMQVLEALIAASRGFDVDCDAWTCVR
jgi:hypothetical protein